MKTIQVIKLQIDLLGLDIENLKNYVKNEAFEEMVKSLAVLEANVTSSASQSPAVMKSNDSITQLQSEHEAIFSETETS